VAGMADEHKKYPELIELPPDQQLKKLPKRKKIKCTARNKNCSKHRGGCGYRFIAGDPNWVCRRCGLDRRCGTDKVKKKKTCRMHGANGGRPPSKDAKYIVSKGIEQAFNRIMTSPNLLDLSEEIGMVSARNDELNRMLDNHDLSHSFETIENNIKKLRDAAFIGEHSKITKIANAFFDDIEPLRAHKRIWDEIRENNKLLTAMMAQMHKWQLEEEMMLPVASVVEWLADIARRFIKYLPNPQDRKRFSDEIRGETGGAIE
jgi:hypothetical protein